MGFVEEVLAVAHRVTLKDVAREVGLSESAVSQVLNERPCRLAEESKQRIRDAAKRLDYHPNRVARGLAMSRSDTIGLVIPDIENPFFASLAKHLERACRLDGRGLFVTSAGEGAQDECAQLRRLDARGVDGIVYVASAGSTPDGSELVRDALGRLATPLVMVDRTVSGAACDTVQVDNRLGAYLAVEYLISRGHRAIACLVNARGSANGAERLRGCMDAMGGHGLSDGLSVIECDYHVEDGYRAAGEIPAGATAVFSSSDLITAGVLKRLYEDGVNVPSDLSLVSFDNSAAFILGGPGITSIEQDTRALAERSYALLSARIAGSHESIVHETIEPHLVEKTSVLDVRQPI